MRLRVSDHLEGERVERIPRQHRGRLVKSLVHRRPPAPQIVIVHARHVVMDQAVDMDALDRDANPQRGHPIDMEQVSRRAH